ncbi:MAG: YlqD family protein [Armatimonadota bacterium]
MAGLTIRRSVEVIAVVTEQFKQELKAELQLAAEEAQRRTDQMELQSRRLLADLQRTDLTQAMSARRQIEAERRRADAVKQDIQRQIEEAEKLELGSEYPRGTLESTTELNQGDDLIKKLTGTQILVKDGVIVEIREA